MFCVGPAIPEHLMNILSQERSLFLHAGIRIVSRLSPNFLRTWEVAPPVCYCNRDFALIICPDLVFPLPRWMSK